MKIKRYFVIVFVTTFFIMFGSSSDAEAAGASIPPWPVIYTGDVTVAGQPAADGMILVGLMDGYRSVPLAIENGRMRGLAVGPPDNTYFGKTITFELEGSVIAAET
ncbi:uncharacterized protein METZ01_LOCUS416639, partial [marine metagenome]